MDNVNERKVLAKRIKIKIIANDNGKKININIPKLPIRMVKKIAMSGLKLAIKSGDVPEMDINMIEDLFDEIMYFEPFELVNVKAPDADIQIYTC